MPAPNVKARDKLIGMEPRCPTKSNGSGLKEEKEPKTLFGDTSPKRLAIDHARGPRGSLCSALPLPQQTANGRNRTSSRLALPSRSACFGTARSPTLSIIRLAARLHPRIARLHAKRQSSTPDLSVSKQPDRSQFVMPLSGCVNHANSHREQAALGRSALPRSRCTYATVRFSSARRRDHVFPKTRRC